MWQLWHAAATSGWILAGDASGDIWTSLFEPGVTVVEKMIRPILVYVFLMVGLRLAGKRELAQLNSMDLIVLLTISNTVQNAIIGPDNSVSGGLIGATTMLVLNHLVNRVAYGNKQVERLLEGDPEVLIDGGQIQQDKLKHELVTLQELQTAAHKQGFASLEYVDRAVLEPSGTITFTAKEPTAEQVRHDEIMQRLNQIEQRIGR